MKIEIFNLEIDETEKCCVFLALLIAIDAATTLFI